VQTSATPIKSISSVPLLFENSFLILDELMHLWKEEVKKCCQDDRQSTEQHGIYFPPFACRTKIYRPNFKPTNFIQVQKNHRCNMYAVQVL